MMISRVDFSLRREVFFVTIGSLVGAFTMFLPRIFLDITVGTQYYITWFVFANIIGSNLLIMGVLLHLFVSIIIGIITGLILYKGKILNISKISNGFVYGVICGITAFFIFFIPMYNWLLAPNTVEVITTLDPKMSILEATDAVGQNYINTIQDAVISHIIWGATLGLLASILTNKFGAKYRCHPCDIQFSKVTTYEHHKRYVHESTSPTLKRILIIGGGFAGVNVLKKIQDVFEKDVDVQIYLVSEDNFFLFTPMLPEISSGVIEPRHIATPIRTFCRRARFFEAEVTKINLIEKNVTISRPLDKKTKVIQYDYLVVALGGRTNFFGNKNLAKYALTIKTLGDAISIRNHIITMLETADQEDDPVIKEKLLSFVIVGGGLSGVETAGEINDFVREAVEYFYRNIDKNDVKVILVSGTARILLELGDELSEFAIKSFADSGIKIINDRKVSDAGPDYVILEDGTKLVSNTLVWAGGVIPDDVILKLECLHDKSGRIVVDEFLRIPKYPNVYVLGDCASIIDPMTQKPYPQTAQHAIREAEIVARNLVSSMRGKLTRQRFLYKSKGTMAKIGRRNGVALLLNHKIYGFFAWFVWRQYYLSNLPSNSKKFRVAFDWAVDLFAKRDITRLRNLRER